jgi:putative aldouronate transport system substrate-binding protein
MKKSLPKTFAVCAILAALAASPAFAGGGKEEAPAAKASANFNATGLPIVKEKVNLHFIGMNMNTTRVGCWDETEMMQQLEAKTNVHITWDAVPQSAWKEKKNLLIASNELPDGFMSPLSLSADEISTLGADGVLLPLDDLLVKYAPTVTAIMNKYPTYDPFVRSLDGKIYAIAWMQDLGFDSFSGSIIRKDWLDQLGLKMPTTTEEFYQVLKTFKEKDPAGGGKTIPFSFLYQEGANVNREVKREFEWIFLAFGVPENPKHIAIEDNGELIFTADKPGFKDAIKYLNRLYSEKLIDQEIFTQDRTLLTNKIRQLNVGTYTDYRLKTSMASEEIQGRFTHMPPLKGPKGDQRWLRGLVGLSEGAFALTKNCKNPEIAIRWLDYINEPENNIQMAFGMFKPAGWDKSEAQVPSTKQPGKYDVNTALRPKTVQPSDWPFSSPISVSPILTSKEVMDKYTAEKASNIAKTETCDVYRPYLTKYPYNYPYRFTAAEIEQLALIQTDLLGYIFKQEAKWILSGNIDAEWDNYLAELKRLKVDEYLGFYKKAYQRSLKK